MARSRVIQRPVLSSWNALFDYCHTVMAHAEQEHFRILFLDRKNVLVADEEQAKGTVDHVPVYPREVVKRALELGVISTDPWCITTRPVIPRPQIGGYRHDAADHAGLLPCWGSRCMTI
jgi:hypothetical protein